MCLLQAQAANTVPSALHSSCHLKNFNLLMQQALGNRAVASTGMNATSSRSHCLVTLFISRQWLDGSTR
jgi:hypothetical protein